MLITKNIKNIKKFIFYHKCLIYMTFARFKHSPTVLIKVKNIKNFNFYLVVINKCFYFASEFLQKDISLQNEKIQTCLIRLKSI